jgi:hypothetical protein
VQIDEGMQSRLAEAYGKNHLHNKLQMEFKAWAAMMENAKDRQLLSPASPSSQSDPDDGACTETCGWVSRNLSVKSGSSEKLRRAIVDELLRGKLLGTSQR